MPAAIPPEELHAFLTQHPIGQAIAAHTGYGPGHAMHDIHHRRQMVPHQAPAAPSALGGSPMLPMPSQGPPMGPPPGSPSPPLGAIPGPGRMPMPPAPPPQAGAARPPLP